MRTQKGATVPPSTVNTADHRMNAASVIVQMRDLLEAGDRDAAAALGRKVLHRAPATAPALNLGRSPKLRGALAPAIERPGSRVKALTERERTQVCLRDGFIDRLSPEGWRLVYPGALRVLTLELPSTIDTRISAGTVRSYEGNAPVWWDLWPTVDHVHPRARGGSNDPLNLACASWWRNAAKGDTTLDELGWALHEPGSPADWDGLVAWFQDRVDRNPSLAEDPMVRRYLLATGSPAPSRMPAGPTANIAIRSTRKSVDAHKRTRCRKDVWVTNSRGAYHAHLRQDEPKTWEAGNGRWRVVARNSSSRRWSLERSDEGIWTQITTGDNSDDLLARAANEDRRGGIPASDPMRTCWVNDA